MGVGKGLGQRGGRRRGAGLGCGETRRREKPGLGLGCAGPAQCGWTFLPGLSSGTHPLLPSGRWLGVSRGSLPAAPLPAPRWGPYSSLALLSPNTPSSGNFPGVCFP